MTDHLITRFQQLITPSRIEKMKEVFGDEPDQINTAFSAALPIVVNAIMDKAGSVDGAGAVLNNIREVHGKNMSTDIERVFSGSGEWTHYGGNMMQQLFGDNENHISEQLAHQSGVKKTTAHNILRTVCLLVHDLFGREVHDNKMDKRGLVHYLLTKVDAFTALFPAGLSLAALGLKGPDVLKSNLKATFDRLDTPAATANAAYVAPEEEKKRGMGWFLPLLLLLLLGALLWWFLKGRHKTEETVVTTDTAVNVVVQKATIDTVARTVTLPDASMFNVSQGSMEYKLVEFLNDDTRAAGNDVWFDFDDVNFDVDKSTLTQSSQMQIDNIAAILKAYPKAKAKVGGYTDKTGNEDHNMKLSQERADAVLNALKAAGVPDGQLQGAEGYGSQFATMPADATDQERRVDRRMALSIREK